MHWLMRLRRGEVSAGPQFPAQFGILIKQAGRSQARCLKLSIYAGTRMVYVLLGPDWPKRCSWRGCTSRPEIGEMDCEDHALPF